MALAPLRVDGDVLAKMRGAGSRMQVERSPPWGCSADGCDGFCRCLRVFCKDLVAMCRHLSKHTSDPAGFRSRCVALTRKARQFGAFNPRKTHDKLVTSLEHSVVNLLTDFASALQDGTSRAIRQKTASPGSAIRQKTASSSTGTAIRQKTASPGTGSRQKTASSSTGTAIRQKTASPGTGSRQKTASPGTSTGASTDPQIDFGVTAAELSNFFKISAMLVDHAAGRDTDDLFTTPIYSIVACLFHGDDRTINALVESRALRQTINLAHQSGTEHEQLQYINFERVYRFRTAVCSLLENVLWALNARKGVEKKQRPLAEQFVSFEREFYLIVTSILEEHPPRDMDALHQRAISVLRVRTMVGSIMSSYCAEVHEAMFDILPAFWEVLKATPASPPKNQPLATNVECLQILESYFKEDVKEWRTRSDNRPVVPNVGIEEIVPTFVHLLACESRCIRLRALSVLSAFFDNVTQPDTIDADAAEVPAIAKSLATALCQRIMKLPSELRRELDRQATAGGRSRSCHSDVKQADAQASFIVDNDRWWKWEMRQQEGKAPLSMNIAEFQLVGEIFGFLTARKGFGTHVLKSFAVVIDENKDALSSSIHFWCKTLRDMDPREGTDTAAECGKIARGVAGLILASEKIGADLASQSKVFDLGALVLRLLPHSVESASILGLSLVRDPALRALPSLKFPTADSFLLHSRIEAFQIASAGNGLKLWMLFFVSLCAPESDLNVMIANVGDDPFACVVYLTVQFLTMTFGDWLTTHVCGRGLPELSHMHCVDAWRALMDHVDFEALRIFLTGTSSRKLGDQQQPVSAQTNAAAISMLRSMEVPYTKRIARCFETVAVFSPEDVAALCDWMSIGWFIRVYADRFCPDEAPLGQAGYWNSLFPGSTASRPVSAKLGAHVDLLLLRKKLEDASLKTTQSDISRTLLEKLLQRQPEQAASPWDIEQFYLLTLEEIALNCELEFLSWRARSVVPVETITCCIDERRMRDTYELVQEHLGSDNNTWDELDHRSAYVSAPGVRKNTDGLVGSVSQLSTVCFEACTRVAQYGRNSGRTLKKADTGDHTLTSAEEKSSSRTLTNADEKSSDHTFTNADEERSGRTLANADAAGRTLTNSDAKTVLRARQCLNALKSHARKLPAWQPKVVIDMFPAWHSEAVTEVFDYVVLIRGQLARLSPIAHVGVSKWPSVDCVNRTRRNSLQCSSPSKADALIGDRRRSLQSSSPSEVDTMSGNRKTSRHSSSGDRVMSLQSLSLPEADDLKENRRKSLQSSLSSDVDALCDDVGLHDSLDVALLSLTDSVSLPVHGVSLSFKKLIRSKVERGEIISQEFLNFGLKIKQMHEDSMLFADSLSQGVTSLFSMAIKSVHSRLKPPLEFFDTVEYFAIAKNCKDFRKLLRLNHSGAIWASIWVPDTPHELSAKTRRVVEHVNAAISQYGRIRALLVLYRLLSPVHMGVIYTHIDEKLPRMKSSSLAFLHGFVRGFSDNISDGVISQLLDECKLYEYEPMPHDLCTFEDDAESRQWPCSVSKWMEDILTKLLQVIDTEETSDSLASAVLDFNSKFCHPTDNSSGVAPARRREMPVTEVYLFSSTLVATLENSYTHTSDKRLRNPDGFEEDVLRRSMSVLMKSANHYLCWMYEGIFDMESILAGDNSCIDGLQDKIAAAVTGFWSTVSNLNQAADGDSSDANRAAPGDSSDANQKAHGDSPSLNKAPDGDSSGANRTPPSDSPQGGRSVVSKSAASPPSSSIASDLSGATTNKEAGEPLGTSSPQAGVNRRVHLLAPETTHHLSSPENSNGRRKTSALTPAATSVGSFGNLDTLVAFARDPIHGQAHEITKLLSEGIRSLGLKSSLTTSSRSPPELPATNVRNRIESPSSAAEATKRMSGTISESESTPLAAVSHRDRENDRSSTSKSRALTASSAESKSPSTAPTQNPPRSRTTPTSNASESNTNSSSSAKRAPRSLATSSKVSRKLESKLKTSEPSARSRRARRSSESSHESKTSSCAPSQASPRSSTARPKSEPFQSSKTSSGAPLQGSPRTSTGKPKSESPQESKTPSGAPSQTSQRSSAAKPYSKSKKSSDSSAAARSRSPRARRPRSAALRGASHPCENPSCANVDSPDNRFRRCGACSKRYCSTECSKVDWKRHRKECAGRNVQKRVKVSK